VAFSLFFRGGRRRARRDRQVRRQQQTLLEMLELESASGESWRARTSLDGIECALYR
jgi:hypothetical protein